MKHPYKKYEGSILWEVINNSVNKLINNSDIIEQTKREYIVGFICSEIYKKLLTLPSCELEVKKDE